MPKRLRKPRQPQDVNQAAHLMVARSTGEETLEPKIAKSEISRIMAAMGKRGGKMSAKKRMERTTREQRSNAASALANARWHPKKP
jgi:hypothetical protein